MRVKGKLKWIVNGVAKTTMVIFAIACLLGINGSQALPSLSSLSSLLPHSMAHNNNDNNNNSNNEVNFNATLNSYTENVFLTRAQFRGISSEWMNSIIVEEEAQLADLQEIIELIEWRNNVKALMSRKEDLHAQLFYREASSKAKWIKDYYIWLEAGGTATWIDRKEHRIGKLNKVDTLYFKKWLQLYWTDTK